MKRVTAFVGSARRKHTYHSVRRFLDALQAQEGVEAEIVMLAFEADYFYPVRLSPLKRAAGRLFDHRAARGVKNQPAGAA